MTEHTNYVVCVDNAGHPASLELRKIYQVLSDPRAEQDGFLRVIDESGEDYLYPSRYFVPISVPEAAEKVFSGAA
jgi:hypothetical protein